MKNKLFAGIVVMFLFTVSGVANAQMAIDYCNRYTSWIGQNCKVGSQYQNYGFCTGCMDTCRKIYNGNQNINEALYQSACQAFAKNYSTEPFSVYESSSGDPNKNLNTTINMMMINEEMKKSAVHFTVTDKDQIKGLIIGMIGDITNVERVAGSVFITNKSGNTFSSFPQNLKVTYQVRCWGCAYASPVERTLTTTSFPGAYNFNIGPDELTALLSNIKPDGFMHGEERTADLFFQLSAPGGYHSKFVIRIIGNSDDLGRFVVTSGPLEMYFYPDPNFSEFPLWFIK